jgi:hypothetical protein
LLRLSLSSASFIAFLSIVEGAAGCEGLLTTIEEAHSTSRCEEAKYIFKTEDQAKSAIALAMLTQQIADVKAYLQKNPY